MNATPPLENPVYTALTAIAPPADWGSVVRAVQSRPDRLRVRLKLHHRESEHTLELKLAGAPQVEDVWTEFERWFGAFRSALARPVPLD